MLSPSFSQRSPTAARGRLQPTPHTSNDKLCVGVGIGGGGSSINNINSSDRNRQIVHQDYVKVKTDSNPRFVIITYFTLSVLIYLVVCVFDSFLALLSSVDRCAHAELLLSDAEKDNTTSDVNVKKQRQ